MAEELAKIDTEVKVTEPKAPAGGRLSFSDIMGVREPFAKKRGEIREEIKGVEGEILAGQQAQKEMGAEGKMEVERQTAREVAGAQQRMQEKMQAEPLPAFVPSQDNFKDIAGLFSLIGVVGMIAGKSSGLAAMNAMNGMLEGYRSGRNDLYKRERDVFDKNFKTMLQKHAEFRKEMDDAIKLAQTNRQAGLEAANLAAVKAGSSIVQAQVRRGDLMGAYETVKDAESGAIKALEMVNANLNAERQAQIQIQAMEARFRQQEKLLEDRLEGQRKLIEERAQQPTKPKTVSEARVEKIEGLVSIGKGLEQLAKDFKPEYAGLGVFGIGADLQLEAIRRLGDEEGRKAASWWSRYNQLQAPNRHALFGATLTGNELQNYQSFTAKTSDAPNVVRDQLKNQLKYTSDVLRTRIDTLQSFGYDVAGFKQKDYFGTFSGGGGGESQAVPSFASEADAKAAFDRGEIKAGAKIKIGNQTGTWQPKSGE